MKKIVFGLALLVILGAFTACENPNNPNFYVPPGYENIPRLSFESEYIHTQYLRTGSYASGFHFPIVTVISSRSELEQYYEEHRDLFSFYNSDHSQSTFASATEVYTAEFFADNFLIVVFLQENSGSNRHKVAGVFENGDIVIYRLLPEMGSADMAQWNIIIELNNNSKLEEFNLVLLDKHI